MVCWMGVVVVMQYEALRHVSLPLQTLAKSLKTPPVMTWTYVLHGRVYSSSEWAIAISVTVLVFVFMMSGDVAAPQMRHAATGPSVDMRSDALGLGFGQVGIGMLYLFGYLTLDSFTSSWQESLFRKYGPSASAKSQQKRAIPSPLSDVEQGEPLLASDAKKSTPVIFSPQVMMMYTTLFASFYSLAILTGTGTFEESLAFVARRWRTRLPGMMATMALSSAVSQFMIFKAIHRFGGYGFTMMMTVRQMLTVIISALSFSHNLSILQWMSALAVFSLLFLKAKASRKAAGSTSSPSSSPPLLSSAVAEKQHHDNGDSVVRDDDFDSPKKYSSSSPSSSSFFPLSLVSPFFSFDRRRGTPTPL